MLKPGILIGDLLEPGSMAQAIELAMLAQGLLDLDDETPDAAETRRKTFIAIATGVIGHLKAQLEIVVPMHKLGAGLPAAEAVLQGALGEVR